MDRGAVGGAVVGEDSLDLDPVALVVSDCSFDGRPTAVAGFLGRAEHLGARRGGCSRRRRRGRARSPTWRRGMPFMSLRRRVVSLPAAALPQGALARHRPRSDTRRLTSSRRATPGVCARSGPSCSSPIRPSLPIPLSGQHRRNGRERHRKRLGDLCRGRSATCATPRSPPHDRPAFDSRPACGRRRAIKKTTLPLDPIPTNPLTSTAHADPAASAARSAPPLLQHRRASNRRPLQLRAALP